MQAATLLLNYSSFSEGLCTHQLNGHHQDGLEGEGSVTQVKEILKTGAEQLQNHGIVFPTGPKIENLRQTLYFKRKTQEQHRNINYNSVNFGKLTSSWDENA